MSNEIGVEHIAHEDQLVMEVRNLIEEMAQAFIGDKDAHIFKGVETKILFEIMERSFNAGSFAEKLNQINIHRLMAAWVVAERVREIQKDD